jgi:hypothetical protein
MLKFVRTDLDSFSLDEISALAKHGYEVAWRWFNSLKPVSAALSAQSWKPWDPCPASWPDYRQIVFDENMSPVVTRKLKTASELKRQLLHYAQLMGWHAQAERLAAQLEGGRLEDERREAERLRWTHGELRAAAERRIGLWNWGDWASYALLLLVLTVLALVLYVVRIL